MFQIYSPVSIVSSDPILPFVQRRRRGSRSDMEGQDQGALRIAIYRGLEKWELMQEIAKRLAQFPPDDIQWTISLAFATRRANSIQAAKELLLNAEPKFPNEPAIKYNLACYFCQMGDIKTAKNYLKEKRGVHLISDAPPFGGLWYGEPDAISNAVGSVKFYSRPTLRAFPL